MTAFAASWSRALPSGAYVRGTAQDAKHVYLSLDQASNPVEAVNLSTGAVAWSAKLPDVPSPPVVSGSVVLVLVSGSTLTALNAATGAVLWRHPGVVEADVLNTAAPVVIGSAVYVLDEASGGSQLTRLDVTTGRVLGRTASTEPEGDTVGGAGGIAVIGLTGTSGYSASGRRLWTRPDLTADVNESTPDVVSGSTLLHFSGQIGGPSTVTAISLSTGRTGWHRSVAAYTAVSVVGGLVLFPSSTTMTAVDATSGRQVWAVHDAGSVNRATVGPDTNSLLLCGSHLTSVETRSGALYGTLDVQNGDLFCLGQPLDTDAVPGTATPHELITVVTSAVQAWTTTVTDDPPLRTDPTGKWGSVDPANCAVDATATKRGLTTGLGGSWTLADSDDTKACTWTQSGTSSRLTAKVVPLGTAADATSYESPSNLFGGCGAPLGGTGGSLQRVAPVAGLPTGSVECWSTGYTVAGAKGGDQLTGVTLVKGSGYAAVELDGLGVGAARGELAGLTRMLSAIAG